MKELKEMKNGASIAIINSLKKNQKKKGKKNLKKRKS